MRTPEEEWNKFKSSQESIGEAIERIRKNKLELPNYIFVVGVNETVDLAGIDADNVTVVKDDSGEIVLNSIMSIRGNIIGIIVGDSLRDISTDEFISRVGEALAQKIVVIRDNRQTEKLLREMIIPKD